MIVRRNIAEYRRSGSVMSMIRKNDLIIVRAGSTLLLCVATSAHDMWIEPQKGMETAMRTYEISSPRAAELYFTHSFVGDVATFMAAVFGRIRDRRRAQRRSVTRKAATAAPRQKLLDRLDAWFSRQEREARERYLAGARDGFDLERRIEAIDRRTGARYY